MFLSDLTPEALVGFFCFIDVIRFCVTVSMQNYSDGFGAVKENHFYGMHTNVGVVICVGLEPCFNRPLDYFLMM